MNPSSVFAISTTIGIILSASSGVPLLPAIFSGLLTGLCMTALYNIAIRPDVNHPQAGVPALQSNFNLFDFMLLRRRYPMVHFAAAPTVIVQQSLQAPRVIVVETAPRERGFFPSFLSGASSQVTRRAGVVVAPSQTRPAGVVTGAGVRLQTAPSQTRPTGVVTGAGVRLQTAPSQTRPAGVVTGPGVRLQTAHSNRR